MRFLPTPSARRATGKGNTAIQSVKISTHALREEGDQLTGGVETLFKISTHALREEGDADLLPYISEIVQFLPTPSARRATHGALGVAVAAEFLPTPSARRATRPPTAREHSGRKISTHALREEGDRFIFSLIRNYAISTHALREEGDQTVMCMCSCAQDFYPRPPRGGRHKADAEALPAVQFLPTPSARRATWVLRLHHRAVDISTHALREEGDV